MDHPVSDEFPSLYHAGVKGMKWGVRKDEYKSASRGERKKIRQTHDKNIVDARIRNASRRNKLVELDASISSTRSKRNRERTRRQIDKLAKDIGKDADLESQFTSADRAITITALSGIGAFIVSSSVLAALNRG